tara:strand:+ start:59 stop:178 length:120 start_codon:yes stop_codon:yes gene_type:complete
MDGRFSPVSIIDIYDNEVYYDDDYDDDELDDGEYIWMNN